MATTGNVTRTAIASNTPAPVSPPAPPPQENPGDNAAVWYRPQASLSGQPLACGVWKHEATRHSEQSREKVAILLIDPIDPTTDPKHFVHLKQEQRNMKAVLRRANELGLLVVETDYLQNVFLQSLESNTPPPPRPDNWVKLTKPHRSAFRETNLGEMLKSHGITSVIVMGFDQSWCVADTVADARQLNLTVYASFDLMQGPKNNDTPKWKYMKRVQNWYQHNTCLVDNYRELPIFRYRKPE